MTINWTEQWELFAPGFKDGCLTTKTGVRLLPGAGFGDLSHPTTQLMVDYLPNVILETVVDVGCGSGILSLSAKALGAKKVYGIDICHDAIDHAKQNAEFNQLEIEFALQGPLEKGVILMNMILSEQKVAWESLKELHHTRGHLVISGLLKEHQKLAMTYWSSFGWSFHKAVRSKGWLLMHFTKNSDI